MPSTLSTTSYALLSLLVLDEETSENGITGYELKQRADSTLRFYWVSPAMSQIYTELERLDRHDYVVSTELEEGRRTTRRFAITTTGREALDEWLRTSATEYPVLKHPIALRLMMGERMGPDAVREMLDDYLAQVAERRGELQAVRASLGDRSEVRYPAQVAEWGLAYFDSEIDIAQRIRTNLD